MAEKSELLDSPMLPDKTGASQRVPGKMPGGVTAADVKRGYTEIASSKIPMWSSEVDGGTNEVGDPWNYGGFLGRPRGTQR